MNFASALIFALAGVASGAQKRSMVWIYGASLFPSDNPAINATFAGLKKHIGSINAVAPQMYSIGCDAAPAIQYRSAEDASGCLPVLISDSSDPGITPDPALATRFHALGPHVQYWPTLSSPDWMGSRTRDYKCKPPVCYNGTGSPVARCPCGQQPNETATMYALLANPQAVIKSALAEAKRWNITGYNLDMESCSPLGDNALPVIKFVNTFSAAMAKEGVQTSYCIGGSTGDLSLLQLLNKTSMRTVPMSLYGSYGDGWKAELAYWSAQGMGDKLGVGFCPTCNEPHGEPPAEIASKFKAAAAYEEIDMFAYGAGAESSFAPYWTAMEKFLQGGSYEVEE